MTETLISSLSRLPKLSVKARSSVFRYKGKEVSPQTLSKELNVQAILNGRVVQRGVQLRLSLELVDAQTENVIWSEQYNRRQADLVTLQSEIARDVSRKLKTKLSGADEARVTKNYTTNPEAYQLYLKGRFYWNKRDENNLRKAIEQFKAAADKDPNYALAFVGLADCYIVLPFYSGTPSGEVSPIAKAYALRALEIDDLLGEAHTSLGYVNTSIWNWAEAEKEFKQGIELNPNYATAYKWYGNELATLGRFDEALAKLTRAQDLEPLSLIVSQNLAEAYLEKGDIDAAFQQCQRAIDLDPDWYYVRQLLGLVYLKQGRNTEALAEAEKSVQLSERQSFPLGVLGYIYAQTGKRNEAGVVLEELKEQFAMRQAKGHHIARVYVGLGENDKAFEWLEKDFQSHDSTMPPWLNVVPLNALRDDPRFKDLKRRMGMPE